MGTHVHVYVCTHVCTYVCARAGVCTHVCTCGSVCALGVHVWCVYTCVCMAVEDLAQVLSAR